VPIRIKTPPHSNTQIAIAANNHFLAWVRMLVARSRSTLRPRQY
jgi:hypothetical protein